MGIEEAAVNATVNNSAVQEGISNLAQSLATAHQAGTPFWIILLALAGVVWVLQSLAKTGINLIYAGVYVFATLKSIFNLIFRRESWQKRKLK